MMTTLKPFTIDDMHICQDRLTAMRRYHEWLASERANDKRELHNLQSRIRRASYNKKGLCCQCGKRKKENNNVRCIICLEYNATKFQKKREERLSKGKCWRCGRKNKDRRFKSCLSCRLYFRMYEKEYHKKVNKQ